MAVRTSNNRAHFYWCCDDIPLDEFSQCQAALIEKLGTDAAIKDLPRVMRLPGTLHLKDPNRPQVVTLDRPSEPRRRWKLAELKTNLGLRTNPARRSQAKCNDSLFPRADPERLRRLFGDHYLTTNEMTAGLETNIDEIQSAVSAIPPAALSTEFEWVRVARGLAHEARIYKGQAEELRGILDTASNPGHGIRGEDRAR
jgi:hypothetical protein